MCKRESAAEELPADWQLTLHTPAGDDQPPPGAASGDDPPDGGDSESDAPPAVACNRWMCDWCAIGANHLDPADLHDKFTQLMFDIQRDGEDRGFQVMVLNTAGWNCWMEMSCKGIEVKPQHRLQFSAPNDLPTLRCEAPPAIPWIHPVPMHMAPPPPSGAASSSSAPLPSFGVWSRPDDPNYKSRAPDAPETQPAACAAVAEAANESEGGRGKRRNKQQSLTEQADVFEKMWEGDWMAHITKPENEQIWEQADHQFGLFFWESNKKGWTKIVDNEIRETILSVRMKRDRRSNVLLKQANGERWSYHISWPWASHGYQRNNQSKTVRGLRVILEQEEKQQPVEDEQWRGQSDWETGRWGSSSWHPGETDDHW